MVASGAEGRHPGGTTRRAQLTRAGELNWGKIVAPRPTTSWVCIDERNLLCACPERQRSERVFFLAPGYCRGTLLVVRGGPGRLRVGPDSTPPHKQLGCRDSAA